MEAKDVRIGNYVTWKEYDDDIILTVIGIEKGGTVWVEWVCEDGTLDSTDCSMENITPIPLTEEWLLKFGFKSTQSGMMFILKDKNGNNFTIESDSISFSARFIIDHYCEIKYVHQLQNLYFALTGEELTELIP